MAWVIRRKTRYYAVQNDAHGPGGKRRLIYTALPRSIKTKREAQRAAEEIQDRHDTRKAGLQTSPSRSARVADLFAEILAEYAPSQAPWRDACAVWAAEFTAYVADAHIDTITPSDCIAYAAGLRERYSPSSVRKILRFLKRAAARAVRHGFIDTNPWDHVRPPAEPIHPPRFLTREQAAALIAAAPAHRALRWRFLIATGARPSEARQIRYGDIDNAGFVRIPNSSKGRAHPSPWRRVPIPESLLRDLDGPPDRLIFPAANNWRRDFLVDCAAAGLPPFRVYDLRHTYGSWLAQDGKSLHRIRDLMGHRSVVTTEIYAHLAPETDRSVADPFDKL